jgi:hypothetical protein
MGKREKRSRARAGKEGTAMLYAILVPSSWVLVGVVAFLWARWAEREREVFKNGNGRWLE